MSPSPSPVAEHRERAERFRGEAARLDRLGLLLANLRLALFLSAVTLAVLAWSGRLARGWLWAAAGLALGFVVAAVVHDRVLCRERRARLRLAINERGLARLEDRWAELPERGERFVDPAHPYSKDLDIFGTASLFQLVDATATRPGEQRLARWLSERSPKEAVLGRQEAVCELAPLVDLREELETEGRLLSETKPDPSRLLAWAESGTARGRSRALQLAPFLLPALTLLLLLGSQLGLLPWRLWTLTLLAQAAVAFYASKAAGRLYSELSAPGERFQQYEGVFRVVEGRRFESKALQGIASRLVASGASPTVEMRRLTRALSFLQLREQPLFHIPLNVALLWDLGWAQSLERWRGRCGGRIRGWLDGLAELEALSSLAGFAHDNPGYVYPELADGPARLEAEALGHPLLPAARRVCNDVALGSNGSALLITGSNMAGKTTLLRTVGINAVLALAGAPVCARRMVLSPLEVRTSMRVQDSLARGLSYFYAEVQRLKGVLDASESAPILFLLDEVLQGTNTAERQIASRAIVRRLVEQGSLGAIATHDLGLTTLEAETAGRVRNAHFTDRVDAGEMSFDYVLRPGIVATTNALAVLRLAGIELPLEGEGRLAGGTGGPSNG